jgi:hypothetical protein
MEMDGHMMVARLTFLESSKDRGSLVTDPSSLVTVPPQAVKYGIDLTYINPIS